MEFIVCPKCKGVRVIKGRDCPECQGRGLYGWQSPYLFYLPSMTRERLALEKARAIIFVIINIILVLFGIFGILALVRLALELGILDRVITVFANLESKQLLVLFWVSCICDMYLVFRWRGKIEEDLKAQVRPFPEPKMDLPLPKWEEIPSYRERFKIDVSQVLSRETLLAVKTSQKRASEFGHGQIEPIHLFIGLLTSSRILLLFNRLALDWEKLKEKISKYLGALPREANIWPQLSPETSEAIITSFILAQEKGYLKIDPLNLLTDIASREGPVKEALYDLEIGLTEIKNVSLWIEVSEEARMAYYRFRARAGLRPKGAAGKAMTGVTTPFLDQFGQDLTSLAQLGYLSPCMDREKEMAEILRIIEGKRPVCLVGPPGVGRSTLVGGLARKMVAEDVPEVLQDKRLVSLSIPRMVAGAGQTGEVEERLQIILSEILRAGNVALFIRDIHDIVGVKTVEGGTDLADMLASALKTGRFLLVSTSLPQEWRRSVEQSALADVLQKVAIEEPEANATIQILEAKAGHIEYRHGVYFSYQALARAAELAERFLFERFQPEKAISLIEETAVYVRRKRGRGAIVRAEDVAEIVAEKTKIPVTKVAEEEAEKLLKLEEQIHKRIIDQEVAVVAVAEALRRARVELREVKRPIANLLFLGPTGVGKTELAKAVAEVYFGDEKRMIRLDMSEYQTVDSISRLIGSPDGRTLGQLTEAVRKSPFALLLLDEIEKAHADILNIFLQVMDDGRLTDSLGRTIDFTNVILIGTSNAGTSFIQEELTKGTEVAKIQEILVREKLKPYFKPEFLNRFDNIVVFKPLGMEEIKKICRLLLAKIEKRLLKEGITLRVTDEAVAELSQTGFDPAFGARPLRRAIQEQVTSALARFMLKGKIGRRDVVILEPGGKIRIERHEE